MGGLQGPFYGGTNTFHRRNAIYGLHPDEIQYGRKGHLFIAYLSVLLLIVDSFMILKYSLFCIFIRKNNRKDINTAIWKFKRVCQISNTCF